MVKRDIHRRQFLTGLLATGAASVIGLHANANENIFKVSQLRGAIDATERGLLPDAVGDQSRILLDIIEETARTNQILYLPAGDYFISNIDLPENTRIQGVPGATRLIYTGRGHGLVAEGMRRISLDGITIDGANQTLGDYTSGLLQLRSCPDLTLNNVVVSGSSKHGIALEACGGSIRNCDISGAADAAIYSVQGTGLTINDNYIHDCANGGILVHRWEIGTDNTIINDNRIERILALDGGTGPYGNGINIFRAGNVMINDNHISDCAFSAIRANSASNINITGNSCFRSGETALYVEFSFEGAIVANNLIDGGANGISVTNFNEGGRLAVVANNVIRNISGIGPYDPIGDGFGYAITIEADTSVTGNTIENVSKWGILAGWGPFLRSVNINGNIIRKSAVGIAVSVVEGSKTTSITNNIFEDTPGGAIVGFKWTEQETKDLIGKTKTGYKHLFLSNNLEH